jgi:hypothetical protein
MTSDSIKPVRGAKKKVLLFEGRGLKVYIAARSKREAADQLLSNFKVRECTGEEVWAAGRDSIQIEDAPIRTRKLKGHDTMVPAVAT